MMLGLLLASLSVAGQAEAGPATTPEARAAIQAFGARVAERSPELAADVLTRDFTTSSYRSGLNQLHQVNPSCHQVEATMRAGGLLFAAAVAERLIERDTSPLNARLAQAAARPATRAYSPSDRVAICVVRSAPDDVARLFAADAASDGEAEAVRALDPVVARCNQDRRPLEISQAGMRAILATAAFRSIQNGQPEEARN
jgi:hypothetical protein